MYISRSPVPSKRFTAHWPRRPEIVPTDRSDAIRPEGVAATALTDSRNTFPGILGRYDLSRR
jgi:hypothetical protein